MVKFEISLMISVPPALSIALAIPEPTPKPALPVTRKFLFERSILTTTLYQIYQMPQQ